MAGRRSAARWPGAALALAAACRGVTAADEPPVLCAGVLVPGLLVTVRDADGGAVAGAVVSARDGAFADTARAPIGAAGGAAYALAHERAGRYAVRVEAPGYRPFERADVRVTADRCHVRTVTLAAALAR